MEQEICNVSDIATKCWPRGLANEGKITIQNLHANTYITLSLVIFAASGLPISFIDD